MQGSSHSVGRTPSGMDLERRTENRLRASWDYHDALRLYRAPQRQVHFRV